MSCPRPITTRSSRSTGRSPPDPHGAGPGLDEGLVSGLEGGLAPGLSNGLAHGTPAPPVPLRLVLLRDTHEHPQVARRREESARLADETGREETELTALGNLPLERLASLVQLIDYASVYLAIAGGIDPAPIAAIQELKARIAQE